MKKYMIKNLLKNNNRKLCSKRNIAVFVFIGILAVKGLSFSADALDTAKNNELISNSIESSEGNMKVSTGNSNFFNSLNEALKNIQSTEVFLDDVEDKNISLYRNKTGEIVKLNIEEYVLGVLSAEMGKSFPLEALKAQAVAIRTYAYKFASAYGNVGSSHANGADLIDTTLNQVYRSPEEWFNLEGDEFFDEDWNKLVRAVKETKGQVITYEDEIIEYPLFFSSTSSSTEDNVYVFGADIPYLKPVDSPWDKQLSPNYYNEVTYSIDELNSLFENEGVLLSEQSSLNSQIKVLDYTSTGRPYMISIGGTEIKSTKVRSILGLQSTAMTFNFPSSSSISIKTEGWGHGVGMSQWGARGMANQGKSYKEILNHYYTGTSIGALPEIK